MDARTIRPGAGAAGRLRLAFDRSIESGRSSFERHRLLWIAAALGLAWVVQLFTLGRPDYGSPVGYDMHAYWLAGRHILDGAPIYEQANVASFAAFKYPPVFAQLAVVIALMPEIAVDAAWRVLGIACWRYLSGSWRMAIVWLIVSDTFFELLLGNVTLQLGVVAFLAVRGDRRGLYLLPWFAAMKFGPALLYPYLWFCVPQARRALVAATALFVAACAVSFALAPGLWFDYAGTFGWEASSRMVGRGIWAFVPDHGGIDFVIRFALGFLVTVVAIAIRRDWLAYLAAVATCPIFAVSRLAPVVGVWPLARERCEPVIADLRWRIARVLRPRGGAGSPRPVEVRD